MPSRARGRAWRGGREPAEGTQPDPCDRRVRLRAPGVLDRLPAPARSGHHCGTHALPRPFGVLGVVTWLASTGCYADVTVRPNQLPKLAQIDHNKTVTVVSLEGNLVELDSYKSVRLIEQRSEEPTWELRSPTGAKLWNEELWFYRPHLPPLRVDPDRISHAVIVFRDVNRPIVVTLAIVAGGFAGALLAAARTPNRADRGLAALIGFGFGAGTGAAIAFPATKHH